MQIETVSLNVVQIDPGGQTPPPQLTKHEPPMVQYPLVRP
jgi:hypothetical protein